MASTLNNDEITIQIPEIDDSKLSPYSAISTRRGSHISSSSAHSEKQEKDVLGQIICSPKMKYIATTHKIKDDLLELFDAKKVERKSIYFPNHQNVVNQLSFVENNSLVVALTEPACRVYIFQSDDQNEWNCISRFELSYFCKSFITVEGKLILFDDKIFQLTKWDVKTLKFETNCLIDWCYKVKHVEINKGGEFLAVYAVYMQDETSKKSRIYTYCLKTGMNLAFHEYGDKTIVDRIYFIAYKDGERLLIISHNQFSEESDSHLMDPFTLKDPVSAKKLLENLENFENNENDVKFQEPYLIKFDNIIGNVDEKLIIHDGLIRKNWIPYLRKELGDYNRIFVSSDTEFISKMILDQLSEGKKKPNFTDSLEIKKHTFEGSFAKWNLDYKPSKFHYLIEIEALQLDHDEWRPVIGESKRIINPNFQPPEHKRKIKIIQCKCLNNDDLLMLTNFGILIWTIYHPKGIRLHYYWGRARIRDEKQFNLLLDLETHELLEDYISDKFFIINYGSTLMETFLFLKEDEWVEKFCDKCFNIIFLNEGPRSTSDIQLLSIIIEVFPQLLRRHPIYLARFLSQTAFIMPLFDIDLILESEMVSLLPTPHLYHFGTYNNLSTKTSIIDIFVSKITDCWNKLIYGSDVEIASSHQPASNTITESEATIKLIIPLPKFVNYPKNYNTWDEIKNPSPSYFTDSIDLELYKYWNGEALINFKWNTYGLKYYLVSWSLYTLFLCCYTSVATLSDIMTTGEQNFLLYMAIFLGIIHLLHEFRQFIHSPNEYIKSPWNYFGAITFTILTSCSWIKNGTVAVWATTITTLLLELKFLFYLRAFRFVGIHFAMIFGVAKRGFSFLTIIAFVVFAFAHSLHLLLRPSVPYSLTEPSYSTDPNDPWNLATTYNSVGEDGVISDQASLIEPPTGNTNNNESYLIQKAEILAEIELFYMLPYQRRKKDWFPEVIIYIAHVSELRDLIREIQIGNWQGFENPFFSPILLKAIQAEETENNQKEGSIKKLEEKFEELIKKFEEF
ncbi:5498_t:CDS:2, partial [Scutellospora calospora]